MRLSIHWWVIGLLSIAVFFLMMVPFSVPMPGAGLDASWMYALNEAVAHHLVFGRDLIFTFGPLGPIYTGVYHPATFSMVFGGSFVLAVAFSCGALLSLRSAGFLPLLAIALIANPMKDASYSLLPFLLLVTCIRFSVDAEHPLRLERSTVNILMCGVLSVALGLLPLIKGSLTASVLFEGMLAFAALCWARQFALAALIVLVPLATMLFAWTIVGQPIGALPHFFIAQAPIISGYSEAMAYEGPRVQAVYFLVGAIVGLTVFWRTFRASGWLAMLIPVGVFFYLFIGFKAGFTRQDTHTSISAASLVLISVIAASWLRARGAVLLLAAEVFCAHAVLPRIYSETSLTADVRSLANTVTGSDRSFEPDVRQRGFDETNRAIANQTPLPRVTGTVDVYPAELSAIFANGLRWSGRPVFQSYSVYTPSLDNLNADFLLSPKAPRTIFFEVEAIDTRLPSLEDASSWPILLSAYRITQVGSRFIQMERRADAHAPSTTVLSSGNYRFGDSIPVPSSNGPVIARVEIYQSWLGKLRTAVFRAPTMEIESALADGQRVTNRYIPSMGENGFIVSPSVRSNSDFVLMAAGDPRAQTVKAVRFESADIGLWKEAFTVTFLRVNVQPQPGALLAPTF